MWHNFLFPAPHIQNHHTYCLYFNQHKTIYPDAQTVETHLYLKLTSFCVNILIIVLFRVLIGEINIADFNFHSSYNFKKCLVRKIYHALAENIRNHASIQSCATIDQPVKRHSNGVSLAGRYKNLQSCRN